VKRSLLGGAVAGRLAAAGLEFVDGALEELAQGEQFVELALVVGQQGLEGAAQAAGASGADGQDRSPIYAIYYKNIKMSRCFFRKMR